MGNELSAYVVAVISGLLGIAGTLLGTWVTYRLAINLTNAQAANARALAERQALIAARDKLNGVFAPALGQIFLAQNHGSTHETPEVCGFVKEGLLTYAAAVEAFRPYVPTENAEAYDEAWRHFHYLAKESGNAIAADWTEKLPHGETLKQRIDAILAFAKA